MTERASGGGDVHRNLIIADIVERTDIDEKMIDRLVRAFYARARLDPLLGLIFERHVGDWKAHFAGMRDFWSSVALMSGRYHGQPMAAHAPLPIDPLHFNRWFELFVAAAQDICPAPAAARFI
jgi:hemoglobin